LNFFIGLISEALTPDEDHKITQHGVGLTCLAQRTTSSISELTTDELTSGYKILLEKLNQFKPNNGFNGKQIYETVTKTKVRMSSIGDSTPHWSRKVQDRRLHGDVNGTLVISNTISNTISCGGRRRKRWYWRLYWR
jgi:hypothetical protein